MLSNDIIVIKYYNLIKCNLSSLTRPRADVSLTNALLLLLPFQIPAVPRPHGIPRCIFPTSVFSSSPCDIPRACQVDCCKMPSHPDNVSILIIPCPCKIPVLVKLIVEYSPQKSMRTLYVRGLSVACPTQKYTHK